MIEHGRDIFPTQQTLGQYEPVADLLQSPTIDAAYTKHDNAALKAKKRFHRLGQAAVLMIAASAIYTLGEALIPGFLPENFLIRLLAVSAAGLGIVLQLYLILTGQKQKWLLNGYATERLRSTKFQAYQCALSAEDSVELKQMSDDFFKRALTDLENELNGGIAVLRSFRPDQAYQNINPPKKAVNPKLAETALAAFMELRVKYQSRFAASEIERLGTRRRLFNSTQDMVYLAAAVFTFIALGAKLNVALADLISIGIIEFLAVTCFIIGATEAILDNALLEEQSQTRFEQYRQDIEALTFTSENRRRTPSDIIQSMEMIALEELADFCVAAQKISYRF